MVDDQKHGCLNRREDTAHIGLVPDPVEVGRNVRRARVAGQSCEGRRLLVTVPFVADERVLLEPCGPPVGGSPHTLLAFERSHDVWADPPRVVRRPYASRHRLPPDERARELRVGRSQERVRSAALAIAAEHERSI